MWRTARNTDRQTEEDTKDVERHKIGYNMPTPPAHKCAHAYAAARGRSCDRTNTSYCIQATVHSRPQGDVCPGSPPRSAAVQSQHARDARILDNAAGPRHAAPRAARRDCSGPG